MTLRAAPPRKQTPSPTPPASTWVQPAPFGGVQVECTEYGVCRVAFVGAPAGDGPEKLACRPDPEFARRRPWAARLFAALRAYLAGEVVSFDGIPLDVSLQGGFRRQVQEECRKIPFGATVSYAQLAARAGRPAAVRATGSAMSHNPVCLLIPCHRVVRSDGSLGGFGAPTGVALKRQLLEMERAALAAASR